MATTRAAQAEKTRQTVLATARRMFLAQGYDATSLQQIADAMGVRKANVYYYFRTKADLLEALLAPHIAGLDQALGELEAIPDDTTRRRRFAERYVDQVVTARTTLGPLRLSDPAMQRHTAISAPLAARAARGLTLLFGDDPTPDEVAAYWQVQNLAPALDQLTHLDEAELRATLTRLCLRVLDV